MFQVMVVIWSHSKSWVIEAQKAVLQRIGEFTFRITEVGVLATEALESNGCKTANAALSL